MSKKIVVVTTCVFIMLLVVFYFAYVRVEEEIYINNLKTNINELLLDEDYIAVFNLFKSLDDEYQEIIQLEIDKYTVQLCEDSIDNLIIEKLQEYKNAGGDYNEVNIAIEKVQNKITKLEISAENYENAITNYKNRNFAKAREQFESVISDDINYQSTLSYIEQLNTRDQSWDNNIAGRIGYVNACAYDGEYLYVPFVLDGVDGIYKIDKNGKAIDFFPLSDEESVLYISGINIVGEYMYFIAGEKIGSGYTFKSPYSIYEMKTDGTNLVSVLEGNFIDMHIIGKKIYVLSREYGLIEYDKNFKEKKVICKDNVVEFSVNDDGIYYTVRGDLTHNSDNTAYFYDGSKSIEIDCNEYLHYLQFDELYVKQWQSSSSLETMNYGKEKNEIEFAKKDICKLYGVVDGHILFSYVGSLGQDVLQAYEISTKTTTTIKSINGLSEYELLGIFYEENKLLLESDGQLLISDISAANTQSVETIKINKESLETNKNAIKHLNDEDIFTSSSDEQIIGVIEDKQNWVYKDDVLHIVIEKRYIDEYDCNVYVTHIFTKNYNLITTSNGNKNSVSYSATYGAKEISNKYDIIYAQNTDAFYYGSNKNQGIIIRQGELVRDILADDMAAFYDDGHMEVFRKDDDITGEQLLNDGVLNSFSFGPILAEDYEALNDCAYGKLSGRNPRSSIGYVEPGHYVMVACDGRDTYVSRGLHMIQLAQIFEDEGCQLAYNLDGGMTTMVLFMGNYITNRPSQSKSKWYFYRTVAELISVGSNELSPLNLKDFTYDYEDYMNNYK